VIDDQYLDTIADSEDQRPAIPPSPNLTPDRMRRDPGFGWRLFVTVTLLPCVAQRERNCPASVFPRLMDKIHYPSFLCHC
jgi:hypothetical protein